MAFSPDGHCRDIGTLQTLHMMREVAGYLTLPFGFRASDAPLGRNVQIADLYGQFLPNPLWWSGESLKTTHDHSAQ
jgi:hypothetical protein